MQEIQEERSLNFGKSIRPIDKDVVAVLNSGDKPKFTRAEIGKAHKAFVTVQHARVKMCGHKYVPSQEPRHRNCEACWFVFFQNHGEIVQQLDEIFTIHGEYQLRNIGIATTKCVNNFKKFMATLAQWKQAQAEAEANA